MFKGILQASIWSIASKFGLLILELFLQIFYARNLDPTDFGIIATVAFLLSFANQVSNFGLGQALIQSKNVTHLQECTVFYLNLAIGVFLAILLFLLAPIIAVFFEIQDLIMVCRLYSLYFILNSLTLIQDSLLSKTLNFKFKFKVNIAATLIAGGAGICLVILSYGFWALVWTVLVKAFLRLILFWSMSSWRPKLKFSFSSIMPLLNFGFSMFVSGLFTTLRLNFLSIVLGKSFSVQTLGFYKKANQLQELSSKSFTTAIMNVLFPSVSKLDKAELIVETYEISLKYLLICLIPFTVVLTALGDHVVFIFFSERWLESAIYLKILSPLSFIYPILMMNITILKSVGGHSDYVKLNGIWSICTVIVGLVTMNFGILEMVYGQLFVTIIVLIYSMFLMNSTLGYSVSRQLLSILPRTMLITFNLSLVFVINSSFGSDDFNNVDSLVRIFMSLLLSLLILVVFQRDSIMRLYLTLPFNTR